MDAAAQWTPTLTTDEGATVIRFDRIVAITIRDDNTVAIFTDDDSMFNINCNTLADAEALKTLLTNNG